MNHRLQKVLTAFILCSLCLSLFVAPAVLAQEPPQLPEPGESGLAQAADIPGQAGLALAATDIRIIVAKIIRVALSFLGIVAIAIILYGGFLWMTSAGNEEQIGKAKKVLINATIGLVIILSALAITQFIINKLLAAIGTPPLPPPSAAPARVGGGALGSGIIESHFPPRGELNVPRNTRIIVSFKERIDPASLAELIPEAPEGFQIVTQTPEGSYLYPTVPVDHDGNPETPPLPVSALRLKRTDGTPSAIQMIKTADLDESTVRESSGERYLVSDESGIDVLVAFTQDLRTFVFTPVERGARHRRALFGSPTENTSYTIYLCGTASSPKNCAAGGIKLLAGQSAFQGTFKDYQWSFEVGTFLDVTPPQIRSVVPVPDNAQDVSTGNCPGTDHGAPCDRSDQPRNVMVQVNFNEGILPTVASGKTLIAAPSGASGPRPTQGAELEPGTFSIMRVTLTPGTTFIAGEWLLGNQYRTAEFVSTDLCGRNSCGEDIFCLPGDSNILTQVLAASLAQAGDPASAGRFDGIEDIAGNSLDGNRDGRAEGPGTGQGYLAPATFYNLNLPPPEAGVPGDNARVSFFTSDEVLLGSAVIESTNPETTLGTSTAGVGLTLSPEMAFSRTMAMTTISSRNVELSGHDRATGGLWDTWWTLEGGNLPDDAQYPYGRSLARVLHGGFWEETDYLSAVSSRVRDLYQNCFYPGGGTGIQPGDTTCDPSAEEPYCCNGVACAAGDVNCQECRF